MTDIEALQRDVNNLSDKTDENFQDISKIKQSIAELVQIQKSVNKNIDIVSKENREIFKTLTNITILENEIKTLEGRIKKMEDDLKWISRLIIGAFIMAILNLFLSGQIASLFKLKGG